MEAIQTYGVAYGIYQLLVENPHWVRPLTEAVEWEDTHPPEYEGHGWENFDVHASREMVWAWNSDVLVDVASKSHAYLFYRLSNREATREALAMLKVVPTPIEQAASNLDDLFGYVIGHEKAKYLLLRALKATAPVHCLLIGPVGTAKSLMLDEIAKLPGAHYYVGSNTTKAGLVGFLIEMKPAILCLDELDKMQNKDMTPLLNLMEGGKVTRLQAAKRETVQLSTRVFASANEIAKLPAPVASRFLKITIPQYTETEFIRVARQVLMQHSEIQMGTEMALLVASEVAKHSLDIRDAVRVGKLAKDHPRFVLEVIEATWPVEARGVRQLPRG